MHIVIDCNVLISAGWNDGIGRRAFRIAILQHTPVISPSIIEEYEDVIGRPNFKHVHGDLTQLYKDLRAVARVVAPVVNPYRLPDAKDEQFIAAALAGHADEIITGNTRHFPEPSYGSVRILSPRAFLDLADVAVVAVVEESHHS